jgi:hypothetical protein
MVGLLIAGASAVIFAGLYVAGIVEARMDLRRNGHWVEPPRPLPRARIWRRGS